MKTLITFLGRVRKQDGGDYEKARYRFPDGVHETAYLGLELARYLRPDRVVILGTAGSQWEFLLLQAGTEEAWPWPNAWTRPSVRAVWTHSCWIRQARSFPGISEMKSCCG
jgi:hypothetical protein